ncbi:3'-5' exonuclease [Pedobacter frigidisoli]|uniref:3'-5' exonuclease n=1 Tax=Pedobacter frigidisoli TaxID=2530455 RepID=UPI0013F1653D|nr:3'-5' exonuclease [Pedobacter frigidisoli]
MQDFFLLVDTETSGLPKNWSAPYADEKSWPYIIQFAWIIYDKNYNEVKRENHYINNNDFKIAQSSQNIHHITKDYLVAHGEDRKNVMLKFEEDVENYKPLIIGHFMEFDYHMINVEYERIGVSSIFKKQPFFCTMKASAPFVKNPSVELLKLNAFYAELFDEEPKASHNALSDALNTAKIFFHLLTSGQINQSVIASQDNDFALERNPSSGISKARKIINRLFSFVFYG